MTKTEKKNLLKNNPDNEPLRREVIEEIAQNALKKYAEAFKELAK